MKNMLPIIGACRPDYVRYKVFIEELIRLVSASQELKAINRLQ